MGEIVNLNRARKDRAKAAKTAKAATNRVAHGRTKAERMAAERERDRASNLLEGHRRDKDQD